MDTESKKSSLKVTYQLPNIVGDNPSEKELTDGIEAAKKLLNATAVASGVIKPSDRIMFNMGPVHIAVDNVHGHWAVSLTWLF